MAQRVPDSSGLFDTLGTSDIAVVQSVLSLYEYVTGLIFFRELATSAQLEAFAEAFLTTETTLASVSGSAGISDLPSVNGGYTSGPGCPF